MSIAQLGIRRKLERPTFLKNNHFPLRVMNNSPPVEILLNVDL